MPTPEEWRRAMHLEAPQASPALTPQLQRLLGMMHYARLTTLQAVEGLTQAELDAVPPGFSNSVATLLAHIAATDKLYQAFSFAGRDPITEQDPGYAPYLGAMTFGEQGEVVRGRSLTTLLSELAAVREVTVQELSQRDDAWLASGMQLSGKESQPAWCSQHWAWFHVMEDEVSHRGQIRVLRKALASAPAV